MKTIAMKKANQPIDIMQQLSKNFALWEFLKSRTAVRNDIDMTPPPEVIANLKRLCVGILQPVRDATRSPIIVSSGYRPPALNTEIGGARNSAHLTGCAVDFSVVGFTPVELAQGCFDLPYDQLIDEYQQWVHVAIPRNPGDKPRRQNLTAIRVPSPGDGSGKTVTAYVPGLLTDGEAMEEYKGI